MNNPFLNRAASALAGHSPFGWGGGGAGSLGSWQTASPFGAAAAPAGPAAAPAAAGGPPINMDVTTDGSPYNAWQNGFTPPAQSNCRMVCDGPGAGGGGGGGGSGSGGGGGAGGGGGDGGGGGNDKSIQKVIDQKRRHCQNGNKAACRALKNIRGQVHTGNLDKSASASGLSGGGGGGYKPAPSTTPATNAFAGGGGKHNGGGGGRRGGGGKRR